MEVATSMADIVITDPDWRAPLLAYLLDEVLPPDRTKARLIARCAKTFVAIDGVLYKWSPSPIGVAEPLELFRLKCANYRYTADIISTHFKRNNSLVCRVSAQYNHGSTGSK
jgi:hypothetical protein